MQEKTDEATHGTTTCGAERLVRRLALALQADVMRTNGGFVVSHWDKQLAEAAGVRS